MFEDTMTWQDVLVCFDYHHNKYGEHVEEFNIIL